MTDTAAPEVLRDLEPGEVVTYNGSVESCRGAKARIEHTHDGYGGAVGIRYFITILNGRGDYIKGLYNANRESLVADGDPPR